MIRYLEQACSKIPRIANSNILDIGCGTGVPTLWFADNFPGVITAIDTDKDSLDFFQKKITYKNLQDKIKTLCISFFDFKPGPDSFETILAEGLLNVVGFEAGFKRGIEILKRGGYFIIHDEYKDHNEKCGFIQSNKCKIMDTLYLDETIWWNEYFRKLESEIDRIEDIRTRDLFKSDARYIESWKLDPSVFRSVYYVVEKL